MDPFTLYILLFAAAVVVCLGAALSWQPATRRCLSCGEEVPIQAKRCRNCGYRAASA